MPKASTRQASEPALGGHTEQHPKPAFRADATKLMIETEELGTPSAPFNAPAGFGLPSPQFKQRSPRRQPPRPLSSQPVPGRTLWGETSKGCLVELPENPNKVWTPEARRRLFSQSSLKTPSRPSAAKPLVLFGGRPMPNVASTLPKAGTRLLGGGAAEEEAASDEPPKDRATLQLDTEAVANIRSGMGDWWLQGDESEWQRFMDEEMGITTKRRSKGRPGRQTLVEGDMEAATSMSSSDKSRKSVQLKLLELRKREDKTEFRALVNLSRKYHIRLDELKEAREMFRALDNDASGAISQDEFKNLIRHFCNLPQDNAIPFHLLNAARSMDRDGFSSMDHDANGAINFEEFLLWHLTCAYSEEMLVSSPEDRHLRQLARDRGMFLPDVEKIKNVFDSFDTDGSGEIEENEFRNILYKLMNVKNEADVSEKRLHRYWRELDSDCSGAIGFDEFLVWYCTSFPQQV